LGLCLSLRLLIDGLLQTSLILIPPF